MVFLSAVAYVGRLGFYLDDWYLWGVAHQCKDARALSLAGCFVLDGHESRPLQLIYLASTYHFFGTHPLPYHLLNTADLALATILLYFCLRELQIPRYINLAVPLVFALEPHYATDRFWIATHQAILSVTLALAGFLLGLKAIPIRTSWPKFCCLAFACASLLGCSLLAYEAMIGVIPLLILFLALCPSRLRAMGREERTREIPARLILCCVATACVAASLHFKFHAQASFPLSQVASAADPLRFWTFPGILRQVALQAALFTELKYGIELPAAAWELYRTWGAGLLPLITGGLITICVFVYLNRASQRTDPSRLNAKCAIQLMFSGLVVFAFAYLPFHIFFSWSFVEIGINNRVTVGAALGAALVTAGTVIAIACPFRSPRFRLWVIGAALALISGLNQICISSFAECWARARSQQVQIISEVQRNIRPLKARTILLDDFCPWIGPAASFVNDQDTSAAFQTTLGDPSITVDVASFGATVDAGYVGLPAGDFGKSRRYEYSDNLLLYNVAGNKFVPIADRFAAQRNIDTMDECPTASGGELSPTWHLIPHL